MADWRSVEAGPDTSALGDLVEQVIGSGAVSEARTVRLVTDGQQHLVVVLDEDLVARFPRNDRAIESLRGEARLLTHLAGRVSGPLPVPVHVDESFTLHRMLHGVVTSRHEASSTARGAGQPKRLLIRNSTRRFFARPSAVVLSAIGRLSPKACLVRRAGSTPCDIR